MEFWRGSYLHGKKCTCIILCHITSYFYQLQNGLNTRENTQKALSLFFLETISRLVAFLTIILGFFISLVFYNDWKLIIRNLFTFAVCVNTINSYTRQHNNRTLLQVLQNSKFLFRTWYGRPCSYSILTELEDKEEWSQYAERLEHFLPSTQ